VVTDTLARLESILDDSDVAPMIEARLPVGVRARQLSVRTLLLGMVLTAADERPAHLTRVRATLLALPADVRRRLGVDASTAAGEHALTYRQVERTFALVVAALAKEQPDGTPSAHLSRVTDALVEASVPARFAAMSRALAVDGSDHESFSAPPPTKGGACADTEASWGRRKCDQPGRKDELFFGYEIQAATMVKEEAGAPVPELVRRILLTSCHVDPPGAFVAVLTRLRDSGVEIGDVLADSGYAHRVAATWALPLRQLGATLVTDLHPQDRGPQGTHAGAIIANGHLYCPSTPPALLALSPLARTASADDVVTHDARSAELARYKLGRVSTDDEDGYHRVSCPAVTGKVRCALRESSLSRGYDRPEIVDPPALAPTCCSQLTVTVPVTVCAKTAQKHDYPSQAHRFSYARRTAVERTFSTTKDRASTDLTRGWCRMMGLTAISLFAATSYVARNERILDAFAAKLAEDERRAASGLEPKTRRRRRTSLNDLVSVPADSATN
jgi:hypothetical protein